MKPFEEFLFFDSLKPETHACALHELIFEGNFQAERFERALSSAIRTTPMAQVTIKWNKNCSVSWNLDENSKRFATIPLPSELYEYRESPWNDTCPELEPLDVTRRPGIRFLVQHDRAIDRARILFQFHHATTDAAGANLFLEKVFQFYADSAFSPEPEPLPDVLEQLYKERWDFFTGIRAAYSTCEFLTSRLNPFRSRILATLLPPSPVSGEDAPRIFRHDFSEEESTRIFVTARTEGVTLTEYLLAKLLHLSATHLSHGSVQIAIPINVRNATHENITLSNIVSVLFLRRHVRTFRGDFSSTLRKVHKILNQKKHGNSSKFLLLLVRALRDLHAGTRDVRWGFRYFLNRKEPLTTLVFSSLGRVFLHLPQMDLTLRAFRPVPPRIVSTTLQVVVSTYENRLSVTIHGNSMRLNSQELKILFDSWCDSLSESQS